MTRRIVVTAAAEADIVAIWNYTALEYGQAAADEYVIEIDERMSRPLEYPGRGTDCSEIRKGYRRLRSGSHHLYYLDGPEGVTVIRVLHERMDPFRHLDRQVADFSIERSRLSKPASSA